MPWGAAIAAVGALGSAYMSSEASKNAARSQQQATDAAMAEQQREYDLARGDYAPYRAAGVDALGQLQSDINKPLSAEQVMSDPGYQFGLQQGQTGLDRKIAAMGGRVSGAALKESSRYNTDYASTQYGAAYQRSQDRLNRLAAIAGIGQTATGGSAAAGMNSANQISGLLSSQGNANAANQIAQGNIWGNAGNQLAALYGQYGKGNSGYQPNVYGDNSGSYGQYSGTNQGTNGGDTGGSYWGIE